MEIPLNPPLEKGDFGGLSAAHRTENRRNALQINGHEVFSGKFGRPRDQAGKAFPSNDYPETSS